MNAIGIQITAAATKMNIDFQIKWVRPRLLGGSLGVWIIAPFYQTGQFAGIENRHCQVVGSG